MKLTCSQADLALALSLVNRAVSPNNTLPVLNNILIKAEGRKLFLCATNLEIAISASFDADVQNEGTLTVPAKVFSAYASLLEENTVEMGVLNGNTLVIRTDGSESKMKGISSEEFPLLPKLENPKVFTLLVEPLKEAIEQVVFAASTNVSRPVLTGLYWKLEAKVLKLVATDSYRLGEKTVEVPENDEELSFIIPSKTAQELLKILESTNEKSFEVRIGKGQILFKVGGVEIISRLIDGTFPDYERIIPKEIKTELTLSKEDFILALKKLSVIVRENNNNVKIRTEKDKLLVFSDETQVGQGACEIPVQGGSVETVETALNVQYLLDVLAHIKDEKVHFSLNDGLSPVMVTPAQASGYLHIIMPLKI
ncbi:MAG: DNA polymerase III subunit beta [Candidatus Gracilibacteria bacterium]|jgi:DNA polymerase-3 subunit beta